MKTYLFLTFIFCSFLSQSQTNLVTDGGLENWTDTNTLENWTTENDVSQNTIDFSEGISSASLAIVNSNLNPKVLTQVPLVNGVKYTVTYKFKYINSNFGGNHPVCIKLIRNGSGTTVTSCSFASNNEWTEKSLDFEPDQTGDYDLSISTTTFDGQPFQVLIDDVRIFDPSSLAIEDVKNSQYIKIYPTVTSGMVYFTNNETINISNIYVYDINGNRKNIKPKSDSIDLSSLPTGIYLLKIISDRGNINKKIIKK